MGWKFRKSAFFTHDINDPVGRRMGRFYTLFIDHGILRALWSNFSEVAPGLYRSNQPSHSRLERYAALGIRNVISLRGGNNFAPLRFEKESCRAIGLRMKTVKLSATKPSEREQLLRLLTLFDTLEGPILLHCKSGADRTGLAVAFYLIHKHGAKACDVSEHLSFARLHFSWMRAGVQGLVLREFGQAQMRGITLRDWLSDEYDPDAIQARFDAMGWLERLRL